MQEAHRHEKPETLYSQNESAGPRTVALAFRRAHARIHAARRELYPRRLDSHGKLVNSLFFGENMIQNLREVRLKLCE